MSRTGTFITRARKICFFGYNNNSIISRHGARFMRNEFLFCRQFVHVAPTTTSTPSLLNKRGSHRNNEIQTGIPFLNRRISNSELGENTIKISSHDVKDNGKSCTFTWDSGFQSKFHSVWLRHNCCCEACRHVSGQRLINPANIAHDIEIDTVRLKDEVVEFVWKGEESHVGVLPQRYLLDHNYNHDTLMSVRKAVKTDEAVKAVPTIQYEDIMNSKQECHRCLQQINHHGLSLVKGVPLEDKMVMKVGELIAPVWESIYGKTFDVIVEENPINVAYSDVGLVYHMDLVYFESPPGLQLLHCLKFDNQIDGGESILLDIFTHAEEFRVNHPTHFETLTQVPATFQKVHFDRDLPVHLVNQKPHIKLNHYGDIVACYWAPPFEGPLSVAEEDVERYYAAYEIFAKSMTTSPHQLTYRMVPGDLLVFNNLRILHGRKAFTRHETARHLQGCYINIDFFKSKTQVMNDMIGDGCLTKRVGNQCWR